MSKPTIVFDVDGTLITEEGYANSTPRWDVIQLFKTFEKLGYKMYIHSGGGVDYAKQWRDKLGLDAEVRPKGCSRTYDLAVDDMISTATDTEGVKARGVIQV